MYPPPIGIAKMHGQNDKLGFAECVCVCVCIKKIIHRETRAIGDFSSFGLLSTVRNLGESRITDRQSTAINFIVPLDDGRFYSEMTKQTGRRVR